MTDDAWRSPWSTGQGLSTAHRRRNGNRIPRRRHPFFSAWLRSRARFRSGPPWLRRETSARECREDRPGVACDRRTRTPPLDDPLTLAVGSRIAIRQARRMRRAISVRFEPHAVEESQDGCRHRGSSSPRAGVRASGTPTARSVARIPPHHVAVEVRRARRRAPQEQAGLDLEAVVARTRPAHGRSRAGLVPTSLAA